MGEYLTHPKLPQEADKLVGRLARWGEGDTPFAHDAFEAAHYIDDMWRILQDQKAVHLNMLRGGIAKLSWENVKHLHEQAQRQETALRAIIERADNGSLGSSKVQDMKRLAMEALGIDSTP